MKNFQCFQSNPNYSVNITIDSFNINSTEFEYTAPSVEPTNAPSIIPTINIAESNIYLPVRIITQNDQSYTDFIDTITDANPIQFQNSGKKKKNDVLLWCV